LIGLGGVVRWKQWHLILEAFSQLPHDLARCFRFDHWGGTVPTKDSRDFSAQIERQRAQYSLEDQVCFHGAIPDATGELVKADWFVLPSTNEPCSLALIEALALGVPALVTSSGGNVDIVQHGRTGLHFRTQDASDLADKLRLLAKGEITLESPSALRESVRSRSASEVVPTYRALYESLA
jgi:glycosyltransferase involved in cell wall biosynthesis